MGRRRKEGKGRGKKRNGRRRDEGGERREETETDVLNSFVQQFPEFSG